MSLVQQRITIGAPRPFNIRDNGGTLLLARGRMTASAALRQPLFARAALVDLDGLRNLRTTVQHAAAEPLPGWWTACLGRLGQALRHPAQHGSVDALDQAVPPVLALIARDKGLPVLQIPRHQDNRLLPYGIDHSMHAAIADSLVAQRLGWTSDDSLRVVKAALTMNISLLALQGRLAVQATRPRRNSGPPSWPTWPSAVCRLPSATACWRSPASPTPIGWTPCPATAKPPMAGASRWAAGSRATPPRWSRRLASTQPAAGCAWLRARPAWWPGAA